MMLMLPLSITGLALTTLVPPVSRRPLMAARPILQARDDLPSRTRVRSPPVLCAAIADAAPIDEASVAWAASLGDGVHGAMEAAAVHASFARLAASAEFASQTWTRRALLLREEPGIAGSFTLEHLATAVEEDFLDAGRGIAKDPRGGGWKMAPVSEPRGSSFEDAKMRYVDVEAAMRRGTVVFNSAGAHIPRLGAMCLAALDAFGLPNCLNLYATARGTSTSAPPHTDKQDVFVLQSAGAKRWRVFEPPPPERRPAADPLARGKAHDALSLEELGEPVIDTVLTPGDVLYMPAGWPHTTDTVHTSAAGVSAEDDSLHLTIGIDTHIWGLDYVGLRAGALARAKLPDSLAETRLPADDYWRLLRIPSHLGFLRRHAAATAADANAADAADAAESANDLAEGSRGTVATELAVCTQAAEPYRWEGLTAAEVAKALDADAVAEQCERHAERVLSVQRAMYADAARDVRPNAPGMPRVSLFRVREHMAKLEQAMEDHLHWYGPEAVARATAAAAATAATPPAANRASGSTNNGGASKAKGMARAGGFGAKGTAGGKKAKKKKR